MSVFDTTAPARMFMAGFGTMDDYFARQASQGIARDEMALRQQQQAQREAAMRQERDRILAEDAATKRLMAGYLGAMQQQPTAPIEMPGVGQVPGVGGPAMGVPGVQSASDVAMGGAGGRLMDKVNAQAMQPADPWAFATVEDMMAAPASLRSMILKSRGDRQASLQERSDEERAYRHAMSNEFIQATDPERVRKWMEMGFSVPREKMPRVLREQYGERDQSKANAQKHWLMERGRITPETPQGQAIMGWDAPTTDFMFEQEQAKAQAEAKQIEWNRQEAIRQLDDQHRAATAAATTAFNGADVDFKAADKEAQAARKAYLLASGDVKVDSNGNLTPIASMALKPPTAEERKRAMQEQDPDGLGNKMSEKDYGRLQAKVAAWDAYEEARTAAAEAKKRVDDARGLIVKANQTREKALGQLIQGLQNPGQQPGALGPADRGTQTPGPGNSGPVFASPSWEDASQNGAQPERLSVSGSPAPQITDEQLMQAIDELGPDASEEAIAARAAQIAGGGR